MKGNLFWIAAMLLLLAACDNRTVYHNHANLPNRQWHADSIKTFSFDIEDASKLYNIYFTVRSTLDYKYCNLFVRYYIEDDRGSSLGSEMNELFVAAPRTGRPNGEKVTGFGCTGAKGLYDYKFLSIAGYRFPSAGTYSITLKQYMREDPVEEVVTVGVWVEKAEGK